MDEAWTSSYVALLLVGDDEEHAPGVAKERGDLGPARVELKRSKCPGDVRAVLAGQRRPHPAPLRPLPASPSPSTVATAPQEFRKFRSPPI
ncbi:hypothetical protein OsI_36432 [Oryza sativa Indica Group]|uniref:Uncharacterized protein n=1 Tax=Oryza sativa subsp. indica TaxID=39946 RepID=B8BKZ4_ORYSI|nr:hypothetical protein OsI_36432 [Oryza sativa Indica Group]